MPGSVEIPEPEGDEIGAGVSMDVILRAFESVRMRLFSYIFCWVVGVFAVGVFAPGVLSGRTFVHGVDALEVDVLRGVFVIRLWVMNVLLVSTLPRAVLRSSQMTSMREPTILTNTIVSQWPAIKKWPEPGYLSEKQARLTFPSFHRT